MKKTLSSIWWKSFILSFSPAVLCCLNHVVNVLKNVLCQCCKNFAEKRGLLYGFCWCLGIIYLSIMINGSKISVHRFIATTLFRMIEEWPHSSGNNEWPLNYKHWQLKANLRLPWDIKTSRQLLWVCVYISLIIIITAPPRVECSLNLFYSSSRSFYIST